METGIYTGQFSEEFTKLLNRSKVSCYQISEYTGIDQAYLSRLKSGKKCNPSLETIIKICLALTYSSDKIKLHDIEALLNSVGRSIMTRK